MSSGGRSSGSGAVKRKLTVGRPGKAKAAGGGGSDIRGYLFEKPARLARYDPQQTYRLVRMGSVGHREPVDLPFKPPQDRIMVMGRRSSADSKPRAAGSPIKVDLGIPSDEQLISRQQAFITLTEEGKFTLTNPGSSSRHIKVRRGIKIKGEEDIKDMKPGDPPCSLNVGDTIVLDGEKNQPVYVWRFEASGVAVTMGAPRQSFGSPLSSPSSSSSSTRCGIQAAVRQSGPENHHPNQKAAVDHIDTPSKAQVKPPPPVSSSKGEASGGMRVKAEGSKKDVAATDCREEGSKEKKGEASSGTGERKEGSTAVAESSAALPSSPVPASPAPAITDAAHPPSSPALASPAPALPAPAITDSAMERGTTPSRPTSAARCGTSGGGGGVGSVTRQGEPPLGSPERPFEILDSDDEGKGDQKPVAPRRLAAESSSSSKAPASPEPIVLDDSDEDDIEFVEVVTKPRFEVGQHVLVQARTGPGMNKQGGFARVSAVHEEAGKPGTYSYDVKYILGGKENRLEPQLLMEAHIMLEPRGTKRRSSQGEHVVLDDKDDDEKEEKRRSSKVRRKERDSTTNPHTPDGEGDEEGEETQGMDVDEEEERKGGYSEAPEVPWEVLKQRGSSADNTVEREDDDADEGEGGRAEAGEEQDGLSFLGGEQVMKMRCTICNKLLKIENSKDLNKMRVHMQRCEMVKREKDKQGGGKRGSLVAKEMPSSLAVCLNTNLSVQDPSFVLSSVERWLDRQGQTVALKFHQDLIKTLFDTACPLRSMCFHRILHRLQSTFPSHLYSTSYKPTDMLAFTDLLQSMKVADVDIKKKRSHDARKLRSRARLLEYMNTIFEGETRALLSEGMCNDMACRRGTMLGRLVSSVSSGSSEGSSWGGRLAAVLDLALKACAHPYVRADSLSRTALLALPKDDQASAKIGKDKLKWFVWADGPEVAAAQALAHLALLMCETYDAHSQNDCSYYGSAAACLETRIKNRAEEHRKATENTLYRYMPGRARDVLPAYASWERQALGGLFNDIEAVERRGSK